jgi:NADH:ubiquinone oxidoreductase subunit C
MGVEESVRQDLQGRFGGVAKSVRVLRSRVVQVRLDGKDLLPVARHLKESGFEHLSCVSAVDWITRYESVYHVTSWSRNCVVEVIAEVPKEDPHIPSVFGVWPGADYHEREAWDLMGIRYEGHPNLERILLPRDFQYHPLRKDFPQEVERQYVSRRKLGGG